MRRSPLEVRPSPMHSGESLFFQTSVAMVIVFWLKWAGYLNLLAQISDRISPFGV